MPSNERSVFTNPRPVYVVAGKVMPDAKRIQMECLEVLLGKDGPLRVRVRIGRVPSEKDWGSLPPSELLSIAHWLRLAEGAEVLHVAE